MNAATAVVFLVVWANAAGALRRRSFPEVTQHRADLSQSSSRSSAHSTSNSNFNSNSIAVMSESAAQRGWRDKYGDIWMKCDGGSEEWVSANWLRSMYMDLLVFEALTDKKRVVRWRTFCGCATFQQFCKYCNEEARRTKTLIEGRMPALKCPVSGCNWTSEKQEFAVGMRSLWNHTDGKSWTEAKGPRKERLHPTREIVEQWEAEHNEKEQADHEIALAKAGHPPDPARMGGDDRALKGHAESVDAIEKHNKKWSGNTNQIKGEPKEEDFWNGQIETWGADAGQSFADWLLQEEEDEDEDEYEDEESGGQGWMEGESSSSGWGSFWTGATETTSAGTSEVSGKRIRGERGGRKHQQNRENKKWARERAGDNAAKGAWSGGTSGKSAGRGKSSSSSSSWGNKSGKSSSSSGYGPKPPGRDPWPAAPYAIADGAGHKDYQVGQNTLGGGWSGHWKKEENRGWKGWR